MQDVIMMIIKIMRDKDSDEDYASDGNNDNSNAGKPEK